MKLTVTRATAPPAKAAVCSLASNTPGDADYGKVKGGASAAGGDKCVVSYTASRTNYLSREFTAAALVVSKIHQSAPGSWSNPYGANSVRSGETLALDTTNSTPPTGQGPLRYKLTYFDSNANHSCTLNGNTGAVTGSRVSSNNQACTVEARFAGNGNYHASPWKTIARITVAPGPQPAPTVTDSWGSHLYGDMLPARVGVNQDIDPVWDWDTVRGAGHGTFECRVKPSASSFCSVASSTCVVTGSAVGDCVVQGKYGGTSNYGASDWGDVATVKIQSLKIQLAPGAWSDAYPGGRDRGRGRRAIEYGSILEVGSNSAPSNPASDGGALEYRVADGSGQYCQINNAATGQLEGIAGGPCNTATLCNVEARFKAVTNKYEASVYGHVRGLQVCKGSQPNPTFQNPYSGITQLAVGSSQVIGVSPTNAVTGGGALRFTSLNTAKCTVDLSTGEVAGVATGNCNIYAKYGWNSNYDESRGLIIKTITIVNP